MHQLGYYPERDIEALTVGYLCHHGLEVYYSALQQFQMQNMHLRGSDNWFWDGQQGAEHAAWDALSILNDEDGYEETWETVERCMAAYFTNYRRRDRWAIAAVEETIIWTGRDDPYFPYSTRLDLLVDDYDRPGLWIVEHKFPRLIGVDLLEGYQLDMQIIGQIWLLTRCVDLAQFRSFRGVTVNMTTKHKEPRFARLEVLASPQHLLEFETSMLAWNALLPVYKELGWPKALGHCAGPTRGYSRCQYFDLCHSRPDLGLAELQAGAIVPGYQRRDRTNAQETVPR